MVDEWTKATLKKDIFLWEMCGAPKGALWPEIVTSLRESTMLFSDYLYFGPKGKRGLEWTLAQMTEWAKS